MGFKKGLRTSLAQGPLQDFSGEQFWHEFGLPNELFWAPGELQMPQDCLKEPSRKVCHQDDPKMHAKCQEMAHLDVKWRFPFLVLKGFSRGSFSTQGPEGAGRPPAA